MDYKPTQSILPADMDIYYPDNGVCLLMEYILEHGFRQRFKRGATIVYEGDSSEMLYLIRRGAVKCVTKDYRGHERIIALMFENELVGSYIPSRLNYTSPFGVVTLEECLLYSISIPRHQDFFEREIDGQRYVRFFTEHIAHTHLRHYLSQITQSPWQRLEDLLQRVPNLMQRISQRDIAAYIGVSPEALSRHKQ